MAEGACSLREESTLARTCGYMAIHTSLSRAERFVTDSVFLSRETSGYVAWLYEADTN